MEAKPVLSLHSVIEYYKSIKNNCITEMLVHMLMQIARKMNLYY